jgi:hypothetical protein
MQPKNVGQQTRNRNLVTLLARAEVPFSVVSVISVRSEVMFFFAAHEDSPSERAKILRLGTRSHRRLLESGIWNLEFGLRLRRAVVSFLFAVRVEATRATARSRRRRMPIHSAML